MAAIGNLETTNQQRVTSQKSEGLNCGGNRKCGAAKLFFILFTVHFATLSVTLTLQRLIVGRQLNYDIPAISYPEENKNWLAE
jgi:hypothetical protein